MHDVYIRCITWHRKLVLYCKSPISILVYAPHDLCCLFGCKEVGNVIGLYDSLH
jgi:hypothetical protein